MFAAKDNPVLNQALRIHFHHSKAELIKFCIPKGTLKAGWYIQ